MEINGYYWEFLERNSDKEEIIIYGGAGAGKSYAVAQYLLWQAFHEPNLRILALRKVLRSVRDTVYPLCRELCEAMNIPYKDRRAEMKLVFPNRSEIWFRGLDDPEKIKSSEYSIAWLEEATEFTEDEYLYIKLRLRRKRERKPNQIYLTFNPIYIEWLIRKVNSSDPNTAVLKCNYKDNPFITRQYIAQLENLGTYSTELYKIYALGEFALPQDVVYTNWLVVDHLPNVYDRVNIGIDFGFNAPTAILKVGIRQSDVFVIEEVYETKLTTDDIARYLRKLAIGVHDIFADPSEPARIEELRRMGLWVSPGNRDVKIGIDLLKRMKIYIYRSCINTINEIKTYSWRRKAGQLTDEPVNFNDHAMDALRYAVASVPESDYIVGAHILGKDKISNAYVTEGSRWHKGGEY